MGIATTTLKLTMLTQMTARKQDCWIEKLAKFVCSKLNI